MNIPPDKTLNVMFPRGRNAFIMHSRLVSIIYSGKGERKSCQLMNMISGNSHDELSLCGSVLRRLRMCVRFVWNYKKKKKIGQVG